MDIKEVEQRISRCLILFEGKELTRRQTRAKILSIPVSEGKCVKCDGTGMGQFPHNCKAHCDDCKGSGLIPVTIEDLIKKEKLNDK